MTKTKHGKAPKRAELDQLPLFNPDPTTWQFDLSEVPQTSRRFSDYVLGQLKMRYALRELRKTDLAAFSTNFTSRGEIRTGLSSDGHPFKDLSGGSISCGLRVLSGYSCIRRGNYNITTLKGMKN